MSKRKAFVLNSKIKYNGKWIPAGGEFKPLGNRNDQAIIDTKCKIVVVEDYTCVICGRSFATERGLSTHERSCKGDK